MKTMPLITELNKSTAPFIYVLNTKKREVLLSKTINNSIRDLIEHECLQYLFKVQINNFREKNKTDLMKCSIEEFCGEEFCGEEFCGEEFCGEEFCGEEFCGEEFCGEEFTKTPSLRENLLGKSFYIFHNFLGISFCIMEFFSKDILIIVGGYRCIEETPKYKNKILKELENLSFHFPYKKFFLVEKEYKELHEKIIHILFNQEEKELIAMIKFLKEDFSQNYSLNDLSNEFFLAKRTIQRRFETRLGRTYTDFYREIKMRYANTLLKKRYPVEKVANLTGYSSVHAFRKAYHLTFGHNPRKYEIKKGEI